MPDIEMAANGEFAILSAQVMSNMKSLLDLSTVTTKLWHKVDAIESKMETMIDETQANFKALKTDDIRRKKKGKKRDAKDIERRTADAQRRTDDEERRTKDAERDAKNAENDKMLALLQSERSNNKRPADFQGGNVLLKRPKNIYLYLNGFMWEKTIKKTRYRQRGFKTIDEAQQAMAFYFDNFEEQDTSMNDAA